MLVPIQPLAQKTFQNWNQSVLTETDFHSFCEQNDIIYVETNLISAAGEYIVHRDKDFILVNSFCARRFKLWVQFHELAHYLMHSPGKFSIALHRKFDFEANVFATVALIPFVLFENYSITEIIEFYDYPPELIDFRLKVAERKKF